MGEVHFALILVISNNSDLEAKNEHKETYIERKQWYLSFGPALNPKCFVCSQSWWEWDQWSRFMVVPVWTRRVVYAVEVLRLGGSFHVITSSLDSKK